MGSILKAASIHACVFAFFTIGLCDCTLYVRESETREVKDISGRWKFRVDDSPSRVQGFNDKWWNESFHELGLAIDMPVPSSYNDITQNKSIRDFVGWAWYQTEIFVPLSWKPHLVWIRIGSAHYNCMAWINSHPLSFSLFTENFLHEGGHLPFEAEISSHVSFGQKNTITIAVNNTLTPTTLPPGTITYKSEEDQYPPGYFTQDYQFDFFNYAGIHRPVKLYITPRVFVKDIEVLRIFCSETFHQCMLTYNVTVIDSEHSWMRTSKGKLKLDDMVIASLYDAKNNKVASSTGFNNKLIVENPNLWWPVGMNTSVGYMYKLLVSIVDSDGSLVDTYRLPVGIRTVEVSGTNFLINKKPFYFLGVGKHEDWDIRGKGFDWPSVIKDFNLLEWLGANSFRTSHYPYAEEIMQLCDEKGIVVVDECPAVGMKNINNFVNKTLSHHLDVMRDLVARDRNHPSVVMWSVANEPKSSLPTAGNYFKQVIEYTKTLDPSRPVTFVCNEGYNTDLATPYVDVVSVNKYSSWYEDSGHTEVIQRKVGYFLNQWYEKRKKPVIHMEWGAGSIAGMHRDPAVMFTEEYQEEVMEQHFLVFDSLRPDFLVGEMIWNFADFATAQGTTRVNGNKKGVFTRQRNPKSGAFIMRKRYHSLRNQ